MLELINRIFIRMGNFCTTIQTRKDFAHVLHAVYLGVVRSVWHTPCRKVLLGRGDKTGSSGIINSIYAFNFPYMSNICWNALRFISEYERNSGPTTNLLDLESKDIYSLPPRKNEY